MSRSKKKTTSKETPPKAPPSSDQVMVDDGVANSASSNVAAPQPSSIQTADGPPQQQSQITRRTLCAAMIVVSMWYLVLIWLASTTANPVTLNLKQILDCDLVGLIQVDATSSHGIIRTWKRQLDGDQLENSQLDSESVEVLRQLSPGEYLIPLSITKTGFEITPSKVRRQSRLVYPSDDEIIKQLEKMLDGPNQPHD